MDFEQDLVIPLLADQEERLTDSSSHAIGLRQLPDDCLHRIAAFSEGRAVLSLGMTCTALWQALEPCWGELLAQDFGGFAHIRKSRTDRLPNLSLLQLSDDWPRPVAEYAARAQRIISRRSQLKIRTKAFQSQQRRFGQHVCLWRLHSAFANSSPSSSLFGIALTLTFLALRISDTWTMDVWIMYLPALLGVAHFALDLPCFLCRKGCAAMATPGITTLVFQDGNAEILSNDRCCRCPKACFRLDRVPSFAEDCWDAKAISWMVHIKTLLLLAMLVLMTLKQSDILAISWLLCTVPMQVCMFVSPLLMCCDSDRRILGLMLPLMMSPVIASMIPVAIYADGADFHLYLAMLPVTVATGLITVGMMGFILIECRKSAGAVCKQWWFALLLIFTPLQPLVACILFCLVADTTLPVSWIYPVACSAAFLFQASVAAAAGSWWFVKRRATPDLTAFTGYITAPASVSASQRGSGWDTGRLPLTTAPQQLL